MIHSGFHPNNVDSCLNTEMLGKHTRTYSNKTKVIVASLIGNEKLSCCSYMLPLCLTFIGAAAPKDV